MSFSRRDALRTALLAAGSTLAAPAIMRHAALGADPIKVVGIHDASGGLDIYGKPMIACLDMAVADVNAAGGLLGRQVELINYDPQSNIQLYTQFATQAATKDKAAVVHGGITSASREAIRPVLRKFNTLYFYNTQYEGGVCDRNCFCTGSTPAQNVQKLIPYVQEKWGKKIYIVAADYNYGQITSKWITKYTREGGGEVLAVDFFPLDVTNFGPAISKIQAAKPDVVISALVGGAHVSFYRQWAAAGMKKQIPMGSTTAGVGSENVLLSAAEGDGMVVAFSHFAEVDTPANKAFVERFKAKNPGMYLAPELPTRTYIGFQLWAEGVKRAKSIDRMAVIKALESGISLDTPAGKTTLDPKTNHVTLDVFLAQMDNQAFKVLATYPQQPPLDTASVCDLSAHPNENKQYEIDVKILDPLDYAVIVALQILSGVATLVIVSLGLAVVFGMMRVINLAHGEFLMLGGYTAILSYGHGVNQWLAILLLPPIVVGLVGVVVERLLIRRLYGRMIDTMLATWGLSLTFIGGVTMLFGNSVTGISAPLGSFSVGVYRVAFYDIFLMAAACVLSASVWAVLKLTPAGLIARGTMQNAEMAAALGVAPDRVYSLTFTAGAALSGLAGGLIAPVAGVLPTMGTAYIAKAFITVITGGAAMLTGTLVASGLLGTVLTAFTFLTTPVFGEVALLVLAIVLLRLLPRGITGRFLRRAL